MNELYLSIITGLSIGFLGSFHCIGMCGPIALSLPVRSFAGRDKYLGIVFYNIGRALTYASLGLIFGFLGKQFQLWGLQQVISIVAWCPDPDFYSIQFFIGIAHSFAGPAQPESSARVGTTTDYL